LENSAQLPAIIDHKVIPQTRTRHRNSDIALHLVSKPIFFLCLRLFHFYLQFSSFPASSTFSFNAEKSQNPPNNDKKRQEQISNQIQYANKGRDNGL